jgi:hypothetical protein
MTDQALALARANVFMQQRPVLCSLSKTRYVSSSLQRPGASYAGWSAEFKRQATH